MHSDFERFRDCRRDCSPCPSCHHDRDRREDRCDGCREHRHDDQCDGCREHRHDDRRDDRRDARWDRHDDRRW